MYKEDTYVFNHNLLILHENINLDEERQVRTLYTVLYIVLYIVHYTLYNIYCTIHTFKVPVIAKCIIEEAVQLNNVEHLNRKF